MGYLFNFKYGLVGFSSYSWASRSILTNWNDLNLEEQLKEALLSKESKLLRRHKLIEPPENLDDLNIDVDSLEVELEELFK